MCCRRHLDDAQVLVKLLRRTTKLRVMQSRRRKTHADSPFVVEDLTTRRYKLLLTARSNPGITSAWSREGNIYARVWGDRVIRITEETDWSRIFRQDTTTRRSLQNRTYPPTQDRRRQAEGPIRRARSEQRRAPRPQRSAVARPAQWSSTPHYRDPAVRETRSDNARPTQHKSSEAPLPPHRPSETEVDPSPAATRTPASMTEAAERRESDNTRRVADRDASAEEKSAMETEVGGDPAGEETCLSAGEGPTKTAEKADPSDGEDRTEQTTNNARDTVLPKNDAVEPASQKEATATCASSEVEQTHSSHP